MEKAPHPSSPGFSHFSQSPHLHFSLPTQTPWQPKPQSFPALGGESIKKYSTVVVGGVSIRFLTVSKQVAEPQTPATSPFSSCVRACARAHTHTHTHTHKCTPSPTVQGQRFDISALIRVLLSRPSVADSAINLVVFLCHMV